MLILKIILIGVLLIAITSLYGESYFGGEFKFSKAWYMFPERWEVSKDNFHLIDIYYKNELDDQLDFKMRVQLRLWDTSSISSSQNLSSMDNLITYEILPWEIWVQVHDIPFQNLSLKVGKQYFEWGTADGIHPSSVLNPDDFTDPFALNEKIPVNAINLNYYISSVKLYLIWIPSFTPVKLPKYFPLFSKTQFQFPGIELIDITDKTTMPPDLPDGMGKAVKLNFSLLDIDFSMGYFHGYDYIPSVKSLKYSLAGNMFNQFDLYIEMFFPKMEVYTFDFTTSIEGFGFWGETGVYDYNKIETVIESPLLGTQKETIIDGKLYLSYILGTDYTFESGLYFNFQYSYGLPYVRGKDFLEDYFILALSDYLLNGLIEIEIGNIFGFKRSLNARNNYEVMLSQEIRVLPLDDFIIGLRFLEIEAKGDVLFYDWQKYDTIVLYVSYNF